MWPSLNRSLHSLQEIEKQESSQSEKCLPLHSLLKVSLRCLTFRVFCRCVLLLAPCFGGGHLWRRSDGASRRRGRRSDRPPSRFAQSRSETASCGSSGQTAPRPASAAESESDSWRESCLAAGVLLLFVTLLQTRVEQKFNKRTLALFEPGLSEIGPLFSPRLEQQSESDCVCFNIFNLNQ